MKIFILVLMAMFLSGCVVATYHADATSEDFKITSVFKSVDGLYAEKGNGKFSLKVDKTHTRDPVENALDLIKLMQALDAEK